jgi:hypothetical protein
LRTGLEAARTHHAGTSAPLFRRQGPRRQGPGGGRCPLWRTWRRLSRSAVARDGAAWTVGEPVRRCFDAGGDARRSTPRRLARTAVHWPGGLSMWRAGSRSKRTARQPCPLGDQVDHLHVHVRERCPGRRDPCLGVSGMLRRPARPLRHRSRSSHGARAPLATPAMRHRSRRSRRRRTAGSNGQRSRREGRSFSRRLARLCGAGTADSARAASCVIPPDRTEKRHRSNGHEGDRGSG